MRKARSMQFNTFINIMSSVGVLAVNISVSFFLSPYIIRTIGIEANGFVTLANNFITYADIIVMALNAMAARFISIAYIQKDYEKANLYYNSVFWGNLIIDAALLIPATVLVLWLDSFVNVPTEILFDVKILFAIIFFTFFIKTGFPNWDCGTYITNRLDRTYIPNIFFALFRVVFLIGIFMFFTPHVWYIGLTSCLVSLGVLAVSGYNTHQLTPELKIELRHPVCSLRVIQELVGSGIWSSIANVGNMLFSGLDLLICNIYLGPTLMGVLSLSKILGSIILQLGESVRGAVGPELTIYYAKGDKDTMLHSIKRTMKMTSALLPIPVGGVIVMADLFFELWVPSQNAKLLWALCVLGLLNRVFNSGVVALYNVYSVVNKVKINAVIMIVSGAISIGITIGLLQFTEYPLYVVAGVSSIVTIIKEYTVTVPITTSLLGYKWYQFYPQIGLSVISTLLVIGVGILVRQIIPVTSWITFFTAVAIIAAISFFMNVMIILNKEERKVLLGKLKSRIPFMH
ncbi:MAG: hypothetical protein LUE11_08405 [Clostridia bacterium]|nr:hypothetical protein [Clostridia bacterium]